MPRLRQPPRLKRDSRGIFHVHYWNGKRTVRLSAKTADQREAESFLKTSISVVEHKTTPPDDIVKWKARAYQLYRSAKGRPPYKCTITAEWVYELLERQGFRCAISGMPLSAEKGTWATRNPYSASLDRMDISKGYEDDNVRVVCTIANLAMNTWGEKPLRDFVSAVSRQMFQKRVSAEMNVEIQPADTDVSR